MVRRVAIPLIILSVFFLIASTVESKRAYDLEDYLVCAADFASMPGRSADVLFLGSSRTATAIDPLYIQEQLSRADGTGMTVDRISQTGSNALFLDLISRDYVANKGAPKHVFIEVMYEQEDDPSELAQTMVPFYQPRSILLASASSIMGLNNEEAFSDIWYEKRHVNIVSFHSSKYLNSFYQFLSNPSFHLLGSEERCAEPRWRKRNKAWVYGDLAVGKIAQWSNLKSIDDREYLSLADKMFERRPQAPYRHYENAVLRDLINLFKNAGTKTVTLVIFPLYGEAGIEPAELEAYEAEFPSAELVYLGDIYDGSDVAVRQYLFGNVNHFNCRGAMMVSTYFAQQLRAKHD